MDVMKNDVLSALVEKAEKNGAISNTEIMDAVDGLNLTNSDMDRLFMKLDELGIEVTDDIDEAPSEKLGALMDAILGGELRI